jgi:ubiquinone/menaquinone biosynthesis C-methylase UbiE
LDQKTTHPQNYEEIFEARGHLYNEAGSRCPQARVRERAALLDLLQAKPGEVICDAPAGGGYVADGIRARLGDRARVICVEPARRFASAISPVFEIRHDAMDALTFEDASIDAVASLAGLHHFADKLPVFREWGRVVRPGGRVAVADVQADTDVAAFLNTFVDAWTPGGHDGIFLRPGELSASLASVEFEPVAEELREVPWEFSDEPTMAMFCRTLFGLTKATVEQVHVGMKDYLRVETTATGVRFLWRLRYALARRLG